MERQRNDHYILTILTTCLLPLVISCGRAHFDEKDKSEPTEDHYWFPSDFAITRAFKETTAESLADNGFFVAAYNHDTGEEVLSDFSKYDREKCIFRTEGFYRQAPGMLLDFYASWPGTITDEGNGKLAIAAVDITPGADFVAASNPGCDSGDAYVSLHFRHILGRLTVSARGIDPAVEYSLARLSAAVPERGIYNLREEQWHCAEFHDIDIREGDDISVIPGEIIISAEWTCSYEGNVIASYHRKAAVEIPAGKITSVTLLLSNDGAEELGFSTEVHIWEGNNVPVEL